MFISDFFVVKPAHTIKQSTLLNWINHIQQYPKDLQKILDGTSFIEFRGTVVEDCLHKNLDQMVLFNTSIDQKGSTINQRLKLYEEKALNCFEEIYNTCSIPDHLIHVTCTGYLAPSPAQKYIAKNLPNQTTVTHSYHMGCYGAFPALRIAKGFLANSKDIDIVHTEFCTLHFDPSNIQLEQLVIHALFADGCIRYKISNEPKGFKVIALYEEIIEDSIQSMSWTPSTHNMQMTIAKDVPLKIGRKIEKSLQEFCEKNGLIWNEIKKNALFAVHPGGPKIIQLIAAKLQLESAQYQHSLQILKNHGNMSSATVPHIWDIIAKDPSVKSGTNVMSMAFGPGLTASFGLLQKV